MIDWTSVCGAPYYKWKFRKLTSDWERFRLNRFRGRRQESLRLRRHDTMTCSQLVWPAADAQWSATTATSITIIIDDTTSRTHLYATLDGDTLICCASLTRGSAILCVIKGRGRQKEGFQFVPGSGNTTANRCCSPIHHVIV